MVLRNDTRKGKTDWTAVDALTDAEIARAVRNDPDAVPIRFDWSTAIIVDAPKKKAISIRVDEEVLDFFKRDGAGYQGRMNAVLRHFVVERQKKKRV